ncbi:hypothetical protein FCR2A7T_05390 [Flavobacterium cauense R2A-7]|nr:hypothetical protein FCR2A7T_05390 [Flavobacterium cauense R2A-7]
MSIAVFLDSNDSRKQKNSEFYTTNSEALCRDNAKVRINHFSEYFF